MKKKILSVLLAVCMIAALIPATGVSAGAAWDGTTTDITWYTSNIDANVFYIAEPEELAGLSALSNGTAAGYTHMDFTGKVIVLLNDISLSSKALLPIGISDFSGTFDGRGHTISDVNMTEQGTNNIYIGLFGNISSKGAVMNLNVSGTVAGTSGAVIAGGIAATSCGTIENCSSTCSVSGTTSSDSVHYVGGIVGLNGGTLINCFSSGALSAVCSTGVASVGGIAGSGINSPITTCSITNCYTECSISVSSPYASAKDNIGAICGEVSSTTAKISNCYFPSAMSIKFGTTSLTPIAAGKSSSITPANCASFTDAQGKGTSSTMETTVGSVSGNFSLAGALNTLIGFDGRGSRYYSWVQGTAGNKYPVLLAYDISWYDSDNSSFTISDAAGLLGLSALTNGTVPGISALNFSGKTITLANDIDMKDIPFHPISALEATPFSGVFNGGFHSISNLTENISDSTLSLTVTGLFGFTNTGSLITGLNLTSGYLGCSGSEIRSGGIAGSNKGTIKDCSASCTLFAMCTVCNVGGLTGINYGSIINSYSGAAIKLNNCTSPGTAGGLTGLNATGARILNSYSSSSFSMLACPVTVIGCISGSNAGTLANCYYPSAPSVTINGEPGLIGISGSTSGSALNCASFTDAQGKGESGGVNYTVDGLTGTITGSGFLVTALSEWSANNKLAPCANWMQVRGGYPAFLKMNFTDVPSDQYFYAPVVWALGRNVTSGTSDTTFGPNDSCTRAQAVTFIWNYMGKPEPETTVCPFTDVSTGDWYYKAVLWAYENHVTSGTTPTTFSPNDTVTRGQFVTFLWNSQGKPSSTILNPFSDISSTDYYYSAVLWAYGNGVTSGTTSTTFSPGDNCVRAHVVTFLRNYYNSKLTLPG